MVVTHVIMPTSPLASWLQGSSVSHAAADLLNCGRDEPSCLTSPAFYHLAGALSHDGHTRH